MIAEDPVISVSKIETNPKDFRAFVGLHELLLDAFAYMQDRIDPPSSLTHMTLADVTAKAQSDDLLVKREKFF